MTMLLHAAAVIFLMAWCGIVLLFGSLFARAALAGRVDTTIAVMLGSVFMSGWLLPTCPFYFEAQRNKRMLLQLVRGTEVVGNALARARSAYR
jgi:uncharacterized membrane protein YgdD (TMEM256/DUF423 family)